MKVIIGADLVPTTSNRNYFVNGNIDEIIDKKILRLLENADYRIFNLETPLTDVESPILKAGPSLSCPTNVIKGIKNLNIDFFTLANNHILDQGEQGLISTMELLKSNNIAFAGVGDITNADRCYFFEKENIKIGIYCCCENEFSIVNENHIGANPFNPLESLDHIAEASKNCDHLIVLYHGGREHYRYPSPFLQKTCKKIIDKGASIVLCQHSHCVGSKEDYNNGTIIYGQGNFLFDLKNNEYWNSSLLLEIDFTKETARINYHPLSKNGNGVEYANDSKIMDEFLKRSNELSNPKLVQNKYDELSKKVVDGFLLNILGNKSKKFIFRALNKLSNGKHKEYVISKYCKRNKNLLINYIGCEAHRELILNGLKNK